MTEASLLNGEMHPRPEDRAEACGGGLLGIAAMLDTSRMEGSAMMNAVPHLTMDHPLAFVASPLQHPIHFALAMVHTEKHLADLGILLPPAPKPAANYIPCQRSGNLLYLSGHLPLNIDGRLRTGRIGPGHQSVEYGYQAARQVGLNLIATMQHELGGDLDQVEQIVKLFGIVQSSEDFHEQHKVVNGCSDLLIEVFGPERGLHARSAIGTNALPLDISVEIEAIVRIKSDV